MKEFHLPLKPFSVSPSSQPFKLDFWLRYESINSLNLVYRLTGPISNLVIPHPSPQAQARDFLWEHTCFEFFLGIGADDSSPYYEWNFSPSGEWMVYGFSEYRKPDPKFRSRETYEVQFMKHSANELSLEVDIALNEVVTLPEVSLLRAGASAVIEFKANREKAYWALKHPEAKPDFHRRTGLTLRFQSES